MSMTFSANIDYSKIERVKVYMKDLYPELEDFYFEHDGTLREEETGLYYQLDYPQFDFVHEINLSNSNMRVMFDIIDSNYSFRLNQNDFISFEVEDLPNLKRKIIKAINSEKSKKHAYEPSREGNMYHGGVSEGYIASKLAIMLEIVDNAQQRNLAISCC